MKTKMRCKVFSLVLAFAMLLSCGIMALAACNSQTASPFGSLNNSY